MAKTTNDIRCDLYDLHPWFRYKLKLWIKDCNKKGLKVIITEGFRSIKRQDELYAQGRTKPGQIVTWARGIAMQSQHQWGIAADFVNSDDPNTNLIEKIYDEKTMKKMAKMAKKRGLGWGGDWVKPVDTPHIYLKKWGDTPLKLIQKYGTLANFQKTWIKTIKGTKKGLNLWNKTHTKVLKKKVPNGTKVYILWSKMGWAKVECQGKIGYMKKKYLK